MISKSSFQKNPCYLFTVVLIVFMAGWGPPDLIAQPSNNECLGAIEIDVENATNCIPSGGYNTAGANNSLNNGCMSSIYEDTWYRFTPTTTEVTLEGTSYNSVKVELFASCGGNSISCNPKGSTFSLTWSGLIPNQEYRFRIGTISGEGEVNLCIWEEGCSISVTVSSTDENCNHSDGTATASATSGTPPYTYAWNNGGTTATITALAAGSYTVTVSDANDCEVIGTVTINNVGCNHCSSFSLTLVSSSDETCSGACDGTATVSVTGGSGNYIVKWSNGNVGNTVSNLCSGVYVVKAFDITHHCVAVLYVTINAGPQGTQYWLDQDGDTWGGNFSQFLCTTPPPGWVLQNGDCDDGNPLVNPGMQEVCGNFIDDNCNGVIDENCGPPCVGPFFGTWSLPTPCGLCQGRAAIQWVNINPFITVSSPFAWQWNPWWGWSSVVNPALAGWTVEWKDASGNVISNWWNVSGLCAGDYTVTITDPNGCTSSQLVTITDNCPTTTCASFTATMQTGPASDPGTCDGKAKVTPNGGTPPYSYQWSAGWPQGQQWTSNLCIGSVSVTVTDAAGCIVVVTGNIGCPTCLIAPPGNGGTTSSVTMMPTDDEVTDSKVTATTSLLVTEEIKLYPNPATNAIYVEFQKNLNGEQFVIIDMSGKPVLHGQVTTATQQIDVTGMSSGIYVLQVKQQNVRFVVID